MTSQGWRKIGGIKHYMRSVWESNYARYLQWQLERGDIIGWLHEPETFWFLNIKRGVRSYLPDFKVLRRDGTRYWVEVKGYMDAKSKTKIKRFKKYYPNEELLIVDGKWFAHNNAKLRLVIKNWEKGDATRKRQEQKSYKFQHPRDDGFRTQTESSRRGQFVASA